MFANAYELARHYTLPVITSIRRFDGTVECSLATFVVLNPEGWIVTVAHVLQSLAESQQDFREAQAYLASVAQIEQDPSASPKWKRDRKRALRQDPKWIVRHSFLWAKLPSKVYSFSFNTELDLAIGKLEPFNPAAIEEYPVIKNPKDLRPGTSLCKLGYPFCRVEATYDETNDAFHLDPDPFPVPLFPVEGIFTRSYLGGKTKDGKYEIKFIETSSPGLKGQSGGPIFDVQGQVWGLQSRTVNLVLGFNPKVKRGSKEIEENQFLNVGVGTHPEALIAFLSDHNVAFSLSEN